MENILFLDPSGFGNISVHSPPHELYFLPPDTQEFVDPILLTSSAGGSFPVPSQSRSFSSSSGSVSSDGVFSFDERNAVVSMSMPERTRNELQFEYHKPEQTRRRSRAESKASHSEKPQPERTNNELQLEYRKPEQTRRRSRARPKEGYSGKSQRVDSTRRAAHNLVEKKYRNALNLEIERLRQSIPYIAGLGSEIPSLRPKPSKATILAGAVEYIRSLEEENRDLIDQNDELRASSGCMQSMDRRRN